MTLMFSAQANDRCSLQNGWIPPLELNRSVSCYARAAGDDSSHVYRDVTEPPVYLLHLALMGACLLVLAVVGAGLVREWCCQASGRARLRMAINQRTNLAETLGFASREREPSVCGSVAGGQKRISWAGPTSPRPGEEHLGSLSASLGVFCGPNANATR